MGRNLFTITELKLVGPSQVSTGADLEKFEWSPESHAMPHEAIELELLVRTQRFEPPGSSLVVEQALAATWQPFELSGEWLDQYLGRGVALDTMRRFARLVQRTTPVLIECQEISILGLITSFTPRYENAIQIGYKFRVSPHEHRTTLVRGRTGSKKSPITRPLADHSKITSATFATITESTQEARLLPQSSSRITDAITAVETTERIVRKLETSIAEGLGSDATRKLLAIGAQFRALAESAVTIAAALAPVRGGEEAAFESAVLGLKLDAHVHNTQASARAMALRATDAERDAKLRASARPRAIYRPFANESLYRISARFYGTAGEWRRIYDANHLSNLQLTGNEELIIPERAA